MDAVVVIEDGQATCRKLRDVKAGENVVCGVEKASGRSRISGARSPGICVHDERISSARRVEVASRRLRP
jgi:hypothetical protein